MVIQKKAYFYSDSPLFAKKALQQRRLTANNQIVYSTFENQAFFFHQCAFKTGCSKPKKLSGCIKADTVAFVICRAHYAVLSPSIFMIPLPVGSVKSTSFSANKIFRTFQRECAKNSFRLIPIRAVLRWPQKRCKADENRPRASSDVTISLTHRCGFLLGLSGEAIHQIRVTKISAITEGFGWRERCSTLQRLLSSV